MSTRISMYIRQAVHIINASRKSISIEFDRHSPIYYTSELVIGIVREVPSGINFQDKQLAIELSSKATQEIIVDRSAEEHHEIMQVPFICEKIILNQPSPNQEQSPMFVAYKESQCRM
jgi:hypothetical protein